MMFPIIILKENHIVYGFKKKKDFLTTTKTALDHGAYSSGIIIDSNGNKFELLSAKRMGWGNMFFGWSLIRKGRLIVVEPVVNNLGGISFSEMKDLVVNQIKKNKKQWIPYGGEMIMIDMVLSSENKKELNTIFSR